MIESTLSMSATRRIMGDVDASLCGATLAGSVVKCVALAALSTVDASYQLLVSGAKITKVALQLIPALICALYNYNDRLHVILSDLGGAYQHGKNALMFASAFFLSPLIGSGVMHYNTLIEYPHPHDLVRLERHINEGLIVFMDEIAQINDLPIGLEKHSRYLALLRTQNNLENVLGDGNCGFRATVKYLQPEVTPEDENRQIADLRQRTVDYMRAHRDQLKYFMEGVDVGDEALLDAAFDSYLSRMSRSKVWIGNLELRALSEVLRANIQVFSCDRPCLDEEGNIVASEDQNFGRDCDPIVRLYYDPLEGHYQALRSKY